MRLLPALALPSVLRLVSSVASADGPPLARTRRVQYSFTLHGLSKSPEHVIFAYPCGPSSGAPEDTLTLVEEGKPVVVGSRGREVAVLLDTVAPRVRIADPVVAVRLVDALSLVSRLRLHADHRSAGLSTPARYVVARVAPAHHAHAPDRVVRLSRPSGICSTSAGRRR